MRISSKNIARVTQYGAPAKLAKGEMTRTLRRLSSVIPVDASLVSLINSWRPEVFNPEFRGGLLEGVKISKPSDLFVTGSTIGKFLDQALELRSLQVVGKDDNVVEINVLIEKNRIVLDRVVLLAEGKKRALVIAKPHEDAEALVQEGRFEPDEVKLVDAELKGIGGSRGFGQGNALPLEEWEKGLPIIKRENLSDDEIGLELNRFFDVVKAEKQDVVDTILALVPHVTKTDYDAKRIEKDRDKLKNMIEREDDKIIFDNYLAKLPIFEDEMLVGEVVRRIKDKRINAEHIVEEVVNELSKRWAEMEDPWIARTADVIRDVGKDIFLGLLEKSGNMSGRKESIRRASTLGEVVIVTDELRAGHFSIIEKAKAKIKGIVTKRGGLTDHAVLTLAKPMRIPLVAAIEEIGSIAGGDMILVNGRDGKVHVNPSPETIESFEGRKKIHEGHEQIIISTVRGKEAVTLDGEPFVLLANISRPTEAANIEENGGKGVGLYRIEAQFRGGVPSEAAVYKDILRLNSSFMSMENPEIIVRAEDWGRDKGTPSRYGLADGSDGVLGIGGARTYFQNEVPFGALENFNRAMLRAGAKNPSLRIMYPLITVPEEVTTLRGVLKNNMEQLMERGEEFNQDMKMGIMLETPAAFAIADDLAKLADFFSVGTNDMIQYILLVNRQNEAVQDLYDPFRKAILWNLRRAFSAADTAGIDISVCGDMAADPLGAVILLGLGYRKLSMVAQDIPIIKYLLMNVSAKESAKVVETILSGQALTGNASQRRNEVKKIMERKMPPDSFKVIQKLENPIVPD